MTRPAPRRRAEKPRGTRALPHTRAIPRPRRRADSGSAIPVVVVESADASGPPGSSASPPRPRRTPRAGAPRLRRGAIGGQGAGGEPPISGLPGTRERPRLPRRILIALWWGAFVVALGLLGASALEVGPTVLGGIGAAAVLTLYAWALAIRTGGRPLVFGLLALVAGVAVLVADRSELRTGAAVVVAALAAVLGVMATVPARRFLVGVRECLIATGTAVVGTLAAVGFEPVTAFSRFQYAVMALALVGGFYLVHRLGAGLHGLGRRGVLVVVCGGLTLAIMLLYAEILRRYGSNGLLDGVNDALAWSSDHLYGYPRPIIALLGAPALVWGTHMRARRRQGWWVSAFGVALTAPVACALVNPDIAVGEALATTAYSIVVGLAIGFVIIRIDLLLTGGRGRRAMRTDDESAVRPEPTRAQALL